MSEQTEASDVRRTARADGESSPARSAVKSFHGLEHDALGVRGQFAALAGGGEDSVSDGLGKNYLVAHFGTCVGEQVVGMRASGDGEAVLELRIDDSVPTDHQCSGLVDFFLTTRQDCG